MQWVEEEHATPTELQRRKEREEWEADNVEESSNKEKMPCKMQ